jgi:hypothetical protein
MWAALTQLVVQNNRHWMETGDGLFTPLILPFAPTDNDLIFFQAYGLIIRTALLWRMEVLPFSPILILFLIDGFHSATDITFTNAVAPEMTARLATWPPPLTSGSTRTPYLDIIVGQDPMNLIVEYIPNIQVCHTMLCYFF